MSAAGVDPMVPPHAGDPVTAEVWARILLGRLAEPVDPGLGARIAEVGVERAASEVIGGRSPVRTAAGLRARLGEHPPDQLVAADLAAARRCGARPVIPGSPEWPRQLDDLQERAPILLWVRGVADLRLSVLRSVAVVGTRNATSYGEGIARRWSADLATAGWTIVSGGAFGIDAAAHRGALAVDGVTVCVLACGVDVAYPRSHEALLASIAGSGLIVSESPPGAAAMRQRFLSRNRLIAALTRGTVVVEAALRSGSRSTATEADAVGRPVFAVPGPVTSPVSAGCHQWIRDGSASLVSGTDEVLRGLGEPGPGSTRSAGATAPADRTPEVGLGPREARVLDAVPLRRPASLAALSRTAGLPMADLVAALGRLQLLGLVVRSAQGWAKQSPPGA